eukprot:Protomagalhaensia_sp_Gyna_25__218@NODE_10_length_9035_cov_36_916852_g6_i2_p2_GENE_NODE_10_length_9035_cov_36_916852_g6_i2NODE_10_length_9035_cov_36_916852_g6_i2_p2_ORF_typecomplete_len507_score106_81baeRF_family10/PF18854_1/0_036ASXH/PF13919_6/0_057DUF1413/PF07205_11/0_24_NODE_10_length_9035_cov_36_916852_g6_i235825102
MPFIHSAPLISISSYLTLHQARFFLMAIQGTRDPSILKTLWKSIYQRLQVNDSTTTNQNFHQDNFETLRSACLKRSICHHCEGDLTLLPKSKEEIPSTEILMEQEEEPPPEAPRPADQRPDEQLVNEHDDEDPDAEVDVNRALQMHYYICAECWEHDIKLAEEKDVVELKDYQVICKIIWGDKRLFGAKKVAGRLRKFLTCLHADYTLVYRKPLNRLRAVMTEINPALSAHERMVFKFRIREQFGINFEKGFFTDLMRVAEERMASQQQAMSPSDLETENMESEPALDTLRQADLFTGRNRKRTAKRLTAGTKFIQRIRDENLARIIVVELSPLIMEWKHASGFLDTWQLSDALTRRLWELYSLLSNPQMMLVVASVAAILKKEVWSSLQSHMTDEELLELSTCMKATMLQLPEQGHITRIENLVKLQIFGSKLLRPFMKVKEPEVSLSESAGERTAADGPPDQGGERPSKQRRIRHMTDDARQRHVQSLMAETQEMLRQLREEVG